MTFPGIRPAGRHLSALILAIVVALAVGLSATVFGQEKPKGPTVEQALIKVENDWNDAMVKRDVVARGRILAEDYSLQPTPAACPTISKPLLVCGPS